MKVYIRFLLLVILASLAQVSAQFGCVCAEYEDPVCSINRITYGNDCKRSCWNDPLLHRGPCNYLYPFYKK